MRRLKFDGASPDVHWAVPTGALLRCGNSAGVAAKLTHTKSRSAESRDVRAQTSQRVNPRAHEACNGDWWNLHSRHRIQMR